MSEGPPPWGHRPGGDEEPLVIEPGGHPDAVWMSEHSVLLHSAADVQDEEVPAAGRIDLAGNMDG